MKKLKLLTAGALAVMLALVGCSARQEAQTEYDDAGEQQVYEWKMVTSWPKNFPGLGTAANNLAQLLDEMSGGRIKVTVYGGGELVGPLEVFDAVSRGTAEMGHTAAYYWKGKSEALQFFATVPFGLTAQEMNAWLHYGGGQELMHKAYAKFNIVSFSAANSGVQMGGWFNKEINSIEDVRGLKMRIPGLGGEVLNRAGGVAINLPGGEIFASLQSGAIDATEWVGPYNDLAFGLYKAARYYYYPGWHEPGTVLEMMINKEVYDSLPQDLQAIVRSATRVATEDALSDFTANNNLALQRLIEEHNVELRQFPQEVLNEFARITDEVLEETAARDAEFKEIYESFKGFRAGVMDWHDISEAPYMEMRREALRSLGPIKGN